MTGLEGNGCDPATNPLEMALSRSRETSIDLERSEDQEVTGQPWPWREKKIPHSVARHACVMPQTDAADGCARQKEQKVHAEGTVWRDINLL